MDNLYDSKDFSIEWEDPVIFSSVWLYGDIGYKKYISIYLY
jgi:hypothetical protein